MPPFTDHTDAPEHNTEGHKNHPQPDYKEVSTFDWPVDEETPNTPQEEETTP